MADEDIYLYTTANEKSILQRKRLAYVQFKSWDRDIILAA